MKNNARMQRGLLSALKTAVHAALLMVFVSSSVNCLQARFPVQTQLRTSSFLQLDIDDSLLFLLGIPPVSEETDVPAGKLLMRKSRALVCSDDSPAKVFVAADIVRMKSRPGPASALSGHGLYSDRPSFFGFDSPVTPPLLS